MSKKKRRPLRQVRFREVLAFAWKYWKTQPHMLIPALGLSILARAIDIYFPQVSRRLIDALATSVTGKPDVDAAVFAIILFVGLGVAFQVTRVSAIYFWNASASRILKKLFDDITQRVQRFSTDWHNNSFAGGTVRKVTRGKWAFDQFEDTLYMGLMPALIVMIGITITQFLRWPLIGGMFAVGFGLFVIVSILLASYYVAPALAVSAEQDSQIGAELADAVSCNAVIKAFGAEKREDEKLAASTAYWRRLAIKAWTRMVNLEMLQMGILMALLGALLGTAVYFWAEGLATPGDVSFVTASYFITMGYVRDIGMHIRNIQKAISEMEDMIVFSRTPIGVTDSAEASAIEISEGRIVFDKVTFSYENQVDPVYQDFELEIRPGERVGLVGQSGSGKSTFVKLIQRLYDVQGGRILIDGQDIARVTQESLRSQISLVPQDPILFHRSLAENIAYGQPQATMEEIVAAAKKAHAHEFIEILPQGYETLVGERGVKLSGGERQRVAIARAILADSPILILDEATSSLDSISERYIQDAIEGLMQDRTTIVVAHRLSTIQNVDRILVFDRGRIVEQGTHADLVEKEDGQYRALFEMQAFGLIGGDHASVAAE